MQCLLEKKHLYLQEDVYMSKDVHDKIIKKAAKEILAPLGVFQKGQSRCWLDDNGWFITQVEFQPSGWSKGSHLNALVSFLWEKSEGLDESLSFDVGYREKKFVKFDGDEDVFYQKMLELASYAKEKVVYYRNFNNIKFCKQQLEDITGNSDSFWENWNMAMFCFLIKDNNLGKSCLKRIIENKHIENTDIEWLYKMYIKCKELYLDETNLSQYVLNSIIKRRSYLSSKHSFRKLKEWNNVLENMYP